MLVGRGFKIKFATLSRNFVPHKAFIPRTRSKLYYLRNHHNHNFTAKMCRISLGKIPPTLNTISKVFKRKLLPEKSPQSLSESHLKDLGMQRPEPHFHSSVPQVGWVQLPSSSLLSRQSSSPSHIQVLGMHRWLSQVKSQALGQAGGGGSELGSPEQVFPSEASFSP